MAIHFWGNYAMGQPRNIFRGTSPASSAQAYKVLPVPARGMRCAGQASSGPSSCALLAQGLASLQGAANPFSGAGLYQLWDSRGGPVPRPALSWAPAAACSGGAVAGRRDRGYYHNSGSSTGGLRELLGPPTALGSGGGGGASQARVASEVRTPNGSIKWGCYLSRRSTLEDAVDECIAQIRRAMRSGSGEAGEPQPELAIVFVSAAFGSDFDRLVPLLRERLPSLRHVFGCSAFGVLGGGKSGTMEADGEPALSLTLGSLPGVAIRVFHTLRSSVPEEDAAVERWADFVGVPADTNRHVSFLMFSDPRFTQLYNILEGLDYSFPRAAKLGGMLSVGVRSRQRAMFAWSAQQDVRTRVKPRVAAAAAAAAAAAVATSADTKASGTGRGSADSQNGGNGGGGWLQRSLNLISKLTGQGSGPANGGGREGGSSGGASTAATDDDSDTVMSNGMYLYGAVCLVLHGDVKLDAIVSQGYRAPSPTIWRVEATTAGMSTGSFAPAGHILTISDAREAPPTPLPPSPSAPSSPNAGGEGGGTGSAIGSATLLPPASGKTSLPSSSSSVSAAVSGSSGAVAPGASSSSSSSSSSSGSGSGSNSSSSSSFGSRSRGFGSRTGGGGLSSFLSGGSAARRGGRGADDDDDDDDDDEDSDDEDADADDLASIYSALGVSGTPSLAAIIDVVEALGSESAVWEEVMETCAVAVAADTTKPLEELGPADWEIMELKGVDQEFGTIMVDGEIRRGYRIKIMVRDPPGLSEDLRAQLLAYKREDLRRVLSGSPLPPSFGALVFTDVERTPTSSGSEVSESELINSYLPLPTGGMFGGAQIAPLPGGTELMEYSSVIGVLRAMNSLPPEPLRSRDEDANADRTSAQGNGGSGSGVKGREEDGGSGGSRRRTGDGGKGGGGNRGGGGSRRFGGSGGGGGSTRIYRGRDA
ncbi:hypothetical protein VaNZ11_008955 [Volvox africanus]|uniref:FIST domain-containing protein n=1 Tax=Volvox africanus TaxID=51714 RepID=A0ABQ5S6J9_9CHLO|nr:hypothetical protein VaNZ11_008955 [Volvox africanus]